MMRPFRKVRGGFTLVESVIAVMILGIALGACVLSFSMAMRSVNTAGNQMAAMHAARDELEALRTNSFSSTLLRAGGPYPFTNAFIGNYTVSDVNSATKDVTVNVWYLNRIHHGYSTNTLATSLVSTLHP
ncbi:MAG TPA: type II secretion system protein [Verrucomicrobiae bacterium]|nr:type II secretion system protein [Verrucomicrobiae bacterium]